MQKLVVPPNTCTHKTFENAVFLKSAETMTEIQCLLKKVKKHVHVQN